MVILFIAVLLSSGFINMLFSLIEQLHRSTWKTFLLGCASNFILVAVAFWISPQIILIGVAAMLGLIIAEFLVYRPDQSRKSVTE